MSHLYAGECLGVLSLHFALRFHLPGLWNGSPGFAHLLGKASVSVFPLDLISASTRPFTLPSQANPEEGCQPFQGLFSWSLVPEADGWGHLSGVQQLLPLLLCISHEVACPKVDSSSNLQFLRVWEPGRWQSSWRTGAPPKPAACVPDLRGSPDGPVYRSPVSPGPSGATGSVDDS